MMNYFKGALLLLATTTFTVKSRKQCQCECDEERLSTVPSSVDDRYPTCREEMMGNVTIGDLLTRELQADPNFSTAWLQAERCNVTVANLTKLHVTALIVYTHANRTFPGLFDIDTRSFGPEIIIYRRYFMYKSFHFLLTDALQLLRARQEQEKIGCMLVYAKGTGWGKLQGNVGDYVRTGNFMLASTQRYSALFDLIIWTCHGSILPSLSSHPCHSYSGLNVLVPPYELFKVAAVKKVPRRWVDGLTREYYLESIGTMSKLTCAFTSAM
ncbi:hypothetical protein UPYG_G00041920 [Umbra pygmaea]|uniref:NAD(P)(+)--arginine ADP-ribosyltransferase n=1 Tax=Umbra pygmaea TaxID=75934 RepID=A0ABD0YC33_UMBPY